MNDIKITVITPVYNREDCIGRCIESVIVQNYPFVEYWIVNDGSTDKTGAIIETYDKRYPYIKYHTFEKNKGVNAARNYAIQNSTGDFVIFLDSDDYFVKNALQTINKNILANPGYRHYLFAQDDRMDYYNQNSILKNEIAEVTFGDFLTGKIGGDFAHIMKTDLIQSFPFDENLRIYEGLNFLKIYKAEGKQLFIKKIVVNRERGRKDSISKEYYLKNRKSIWAQYTNQNYLFQFFEDELIALNISQFKKMVWKNLLLGIAINEFDGNKKIINRLKQKNISAFPVNMINSKLFTFLVYNAIVSFSKLKRKL